MIRLVSLLLSFLVVQDLFSQFYIKGRVTDGESQQPLKGASVYINNTTIGTVSNENGEFELGPFQPGRYEVIASYVGYDPLLYSAEIKASGIRIIFKVEKKEQVMREVLVLSNEMRKRYLEIFKKYVLGVSEAAERCEIKNIEEVQFTSGQNKDEIQAYTEKELIIENPELGYTLHFHLLSFSYNKISSGSYFFGYTRFVDWAKDANAKKKWIRKRKQAYEGSTVHFFRSLLKKQLSKEGFTAYQLVTPKDQKKDTLPIKTILQVTPTGNKGIQMAFKAVEDSMLSLYSDSSYRVYELKIKDGWRIFYSKNTSLKLDIMKKAVISGQPPTGTTMGLRLRESPVLLSDKGILLTPINVFYDGMWGYERLANMLPEDYVDE